MIDPVCLSRFLLQIRPFEDVSLRKTESIRIASREKIPIAGAQIIDNSDMITTLQVHGDQM